MTPDWSALTAPDVAGAARSLLGCRLRAGPVELRLTEVEAYSGVGDDPASHAHRGRTRRNEVMFGPAGLAYVYFIYGMHWCLNVTTGPVGTASAVLLRAGEVTAGLPLARTRRPGARRDAELARGPARLSTVLGVDGSTYGVNLLAARGPIRLRPPVRPVDPGEVSAGPRVGVTGGPEVPWRFWLTGEPSVSVYRPHLRRRRIG